MVDAFSANLSLNVQNSIVDRVANSGLYGQFLNSDSQLNGQYNMIVKETREEAAYGRGHTRQGPPHQISIFLPELLEYDPNLQFPMSCLAKTLCSPFAANDCDFPH